MSYDGNRKWHSSKRMAALEIQALQGRRAKNIHKELPTQKQVVMLKLFEEIAEYYNIQCEKTMKLAYGNRASANTALLALMDAFDRKGLSKEKIMAMYYKRLKVAMNGQKDLDRQRHLVRNSEADR